jgi:hypothetical protein
MLIILQGWSVGRTEDSSCKLPPRPIDNKDEMEARKYLYQEHRMLLDDSRKDTSCHCASRNPMYEWIADMSERGSGDIDYRQIVPILTKFMHKNSVTITQSLNDLYAIGFDDALEAISSIQPTCLQAVLLCAATNTSMRIAASSTLYVFDVKAVKKYFPINTSFSHLDKVAFIDGEHTFKRMIQKGPKSNKLPFWLSKKLNTKWKIEQGLSFV